MILVNNVPLNPFLRIYQNHLCKSSRLPKTIIMCLLTIASMCGRKHWCQIKIIHHVRRCIQKKQSKENHIGNKKLRRLVLDCQKSYEKAEKGTKLMVAQEIVDIVLESSGRFLKASEDIIDENTASGYGCTWINVDNDSARTKVSAMFRTLRWKSKR